MKVAMRQIAGAFSQLEKARLVAKLRGARERMRGERGKCEGRKSYAERAPELVALAKQVSLRTVAGGLAERGFVTPSGRHYSAAAVASMLG
jgi:hypothetical protein